MGIIKEMINNIIEERGIMKSLSTLIGESDLVLQDSGKFELRSNNSIKIDGTFSGNIVAGSSIIISETGYVNGNVYGAKIIIAGKVTGDVVGHENIRIAYTANIIGNITTKGLTIDKGCTINGKVTCNLEKIDYNQSLKPETPKNNVSKNELQRKGSPS